MAGKEFSASGSSKFWKQHFGVEIIICPRCCGILLQTNSWNIEIAQTTNHFDDKLTRLGRSNGVHCPQRTFSARSDWVLPCATAGWWISYPGALVALGGAEWCDPKKHLFTTERPEDRCLGLVPRFPSLSLIRIQLSPSPK